jgi:hypothetical protein
MPPEVATCSRTFPPRNRCAGADHWLKTAQKAPGGWWSDWDAWLKALGGKQVPAPTQTGNAEYTEIEPASGSFVLARANWWSETELRIEEPIMKVTVEIDATPQEMRVLMGLPDIEPMQREMMDKIRDKTFAAIDANDPAALMKYFIPTADQFKTLEEFQASFWQNVGRSMGLASGNKG